MSMLGSPVGGVPYRFVDPSSVWRASAAASAASLTDAVDSGDGMMRDGDGEGEVSVDGDDEVRVLLPAEEPQARGKSRHGHVGLETTAAVIPGFRIRKRVWVRGWEVYAIDGWVVDRGRRGKCVVSGGEGAQRSEGRKEGRGVLVDEVVPVEMGWRDHLEGFRERVQADGGELVEIDPGVATSANGTRTRTLLPVTPLPHLAHGLHPIHIPEGNYNEVKERLWVNLNLRRLGCSGRSSVGLAAPSPATEHKFLSQYRIPAPSPPNTQPMIQPIVLELVRLIQTALYIHGLYGHHEHDGDVRGLEAREPQDGLLCDSTMWGMAIWKRGTERQVEAPMGNEEGDAWGMERGELEDPEARVMLVDVMVDEFASMGPSLTALLLSEVMSVRCKLAALDINVPRDPLVRSGEFMMALKEYQRAYHPRRPVGEYLTPALRHEINHTYAKAQHHESTKLSRIFKNQVVQASAGLASNLTGLASATLGSATASGRHHGATDDEGSEGEAQEVVNADKTADLTTDNVDRWASMIKSGRENMGSCRVGDLWSGRVGNGSGRHWQWDTSRKFDPHALTISVPGASHRTHDERSARADGRRHVSAESPRTPGSARVRPRTRHSVGYDDETESRRHRTKTSLSHGAGHFKSMTSKTGHALRDGLSNVAGRVRKASDLPDRSDSDPGPTGDENSRNRHRDLSLASTDASPDFLLVPNISITTTAPSDGASSRTFSYRPSHMRSLSASRFADSEAASEISDFTSDITRPVSRARHSALSIAADDSATMVHTGYMSLSSKLERIVSMDARLEAENPGFGIEFLHSGHDEAAWVAYKREKRRRQGIARRYSYESLPPAREVVRQHPKHLHVDVQACALIWTLHDDERRLRREMELMIEMEAIMQQVSSDLVAELRARRQTLDQIKASSAAIMTSPSEDVEAELASDDNMTTSSTAIQVKRLLNRLTTDGKDLEYSVRNLQNTVRSIGDAANKIDLWLAEFPSDGDDDEGAQECSVVKGRVEALTERLQVTGLQPEAVTTVETLYKEGSQDGVNKSNKARASSSSFSFGSWFGSLWKP